MDLSSKISGDTALLGAMSRLPRAMQNKALRPALRSGAAVTKAVAIQNIKRLATKGYSTGLLARSIVVRQGKQRRGVLRVLVAIAPGKVYPDGTRVGLVGSVFEHGRVKGHGGNRSTQAPQPWLRPAARTSAPQVYAVVRSEAGRRLNSAVAEAVR